MPDTDHDPQRILYSYSLTGRWTKGRHDDRGSPKALLSVVDLLDRDSYEPWFLAAGEGPLIDTMRARDVHIIHGDVASLSRRRPLWSLQRLQRQRRLLRDGRVDLVHYNAFGWNTDLVLAAALEGIPVILHVHLPGEVHWHNLNRLAAKRVVTVSHAHAENIKGLHRVRGKHSVLYNSVDITRFAKGHDIRPTLGLQVDDFIVGIVAQICPGKGIAEFLDVAERLIPRHPRGHFLVVGPTQPGSEDFAAAMMARADTPPFDGRIHFLGSRQDIPDLLASMDLFLFPTWAETFGLVVVEAMAAGLPVVASAVGGIPEILDRPDIGVLVPSKDVDGFTGAVQRLMADRAAATRIGRQAASSLMGRFDVETIKQELDALYRSILRS